jgi:hypothetical protein
MLYILQKLLCALKSHILYAIAINHWHTKCDEYLNCMYRSILILLDLQMDDKIFKKTFKLKIRDGIP